MVDGPNATYMSSTVLDRWEERLQDLFDGRPYDILDAALTDTVFKFPLDIKVMIFLHIASTTYVWIANESFYCPGDRCVVSALMSWLEINKIGCLSKQLA